MTRTRTSLCRAEPRRSSPVADPESSDFARTSPVDESTGSAAVVLASASPRRLELLGRVGLSPIVRPAHIDESMHPGERPHTYVTRMADEKATAVARSHPGSLTLGADTVVVLDGEVLGKPTDHDDALLTLERLAGRTHEVLTAVTVIDRNGRPSSLTEAAKVHMARSTPEQREWYVATGEPLDKAGSYAIQGRGAVMVERVDGDPTTVIGLPLRATLELLRSAGLDWPGHGSGTISSRTSR
jgi:septum formation protein